MRVDEEVLRSGMTRTQMTPEPKNLEESLDLQKLLIEAYPPRRTKAARVRSKIDVDILLKVFVEGYTYKEAGEVHKLTGWIAQQRVRSLLSRLRYIASKKRKEDKFELSEDALLEMAMERRRRERWRQEQERELQLYRERMQRNIALIQEQRREQERVRRVENRSYLSRHTSYHPDCFAISKYSEYECGNCINANLCKLANDNILIQEAK